MLSIFRQSLDPVISINRTLVYYNTEYLEVDWGTRWRSWLRHCATNRKVVGSIPDGVMEILH